MRPSLPVRPLLAAVLAAATIALAACGGGAVDIVAPLPQLQVDVVAGSTAYAPATPGQVLSINAAVGQSLVIDASEPVAWSFSANGSPLFGSGTSVATAGVLLTQSQVSASKVVIDSAFTGPALLPVEVLLTATSTIDRTQVATVRVWLQ